MDLTMKLEGIKRTFTFGVSPEAGATRYQCSATVDFSDTTIGELIDNWSRKAIVVAVQNNNLRKKGEAYLSIPENRILEGKLHDLTKSTPKAVVDVANMSADELHSKMTPEQKNETKRIMIQEMVDAGNAEWVDEEALTFKLVTKK